MPRTTLIISLSVLWIGSCGRNDRSAGDPVPGPPATQPASSMPATCARESAVRTAGGPLEIAVIPMGSTHEFWKAIHAGAVKAEQELAGAVRVNWKGPMKEGDREAQISIVENFINAGMAGIAVAPTDNVALARPLRAAMRAGIGVVIMDSALSPDAATVCEDYASFIATDSYLGGRMGGHRLGEILRGRGNVLVLRCEVGLVGTTQREQGFLDVIAREYPGIMIVSSNQYGTASAETAFKKAENLLNRFPDLDGIFCPNESTTFGMLRALRSTGRAGKVKFVGFDSSEKLIEAMAAGEIHGLVLQDPLNIGYTSVKTLAAYLRGEAVRTRIDTGCTVATPENMYEPRIRELLSPPLEKYLP